MVSQKDTRANAPKHKILAKKLFSLSLIFNALLTISYALGILGGFYWFFRGWQPFYPFIVNGNIFWLVILTAKFNFVPSARLGRNLKTGRLFFHHYFYGLLVLVLGVLFAVAFTSVSLWTLFLVENSSLPVNAARFLILCGFTLILDDLPDTSKLVKASIKFVKTRTQPYQKATSILRFILGLVTFYVLFAVALAMYQNMQWVTLENFILLGTLFVTSVSTIIFSKKRSLKF